jgi:hypothetical protein
LIFNTQDHLYHSYYLFKVRKVDHFGVTKSIGYLHFLGLFKQFNNLSSKESTYFSIEL